MQAFDRLFSPGCRVGIILSMHDNTSRKRQLIQRSFIYGVMTVAVIVAVVVCLLLVLGYRFNRSDGRLEQTALLQFDSFPSGARVGIDNKWQGFNTPNKKTVKQGQHTIAIERDGYRQWAQSTYIKAGTVVWFNYARLVPNSVTTETVHTFPTLTSVKASPDHKWIAIKTDPSDLSLDLVDISNEKTPKFSQVKLPAKLVSKPGRFTIAEWDFGSRYILLKHTLANGTIQFIEVDRTQPAEARNISRQLGLKITQAHLAGNSGNILFILSQGDLRKADLGAGTISQPLVSDVNNFKLYQADTLAYTGEKDGRQVAGIYKDGSKEPVIVRQFSKGLKVPLQVTTSSYFGDNYLAVSHDKKIEIIKDPLSGGTRKTFARFNFQPGVKWLDFSSNGRFLIAQNGNHLASYDLEYKKLFNINLPVSHTPSKKPIDWLDDYHLWSDGDGALHMLDFDGSNSQIITDVLPGFDVTLSSNEKRLFSIGENSTTKQPILQSSHMVTGN